MVFSSAGNRHAFFDHAHRSMRRQFLHAHKPPEFAHGATAHPARHSSRQCVKSTAGQALQGWHPAREDSHSQNTNAALMMLAIANNPARQQKAVKQNQRHAPHWPAAHGQTHEGHV